MKRPISAAMLLLFALAATAQAAPAVEAKEATKPVVTKRQEASPLATRAQRSEVKKRAAEVKKKQADSAAAIQGK